MSLFVLNLSGPNWQHSVDAEAFALKGHAYLDSCPATPEQLAEYLSSVVTGNPLSTALQRLNGFYAWVSQTGKQLRAGVDQVRSWPLFYGQAQGNFYLSEDAEWVRQQVGDEQMDPLAREEFLLAGYVTGCDTLYPRVKQLQAGECLEVQEANGTLKVRVEHYYRFWHIEPQTYTEAELHKQLERVTLNAMRRLTERAAGRQIVIPLSGGYDSRLIASMLKKLGYSNVLCFTYGVPGNKEAEYSHQVAKALNFEWTFVEYSTVLWQKEWSSPEAQAYRRMASNHVSLPHIQDWLAIKQLVASGAIAPDAIVVPGHSGDFVAGSHIPDFVFTQTQHIEDDLLQALINVHLSNAPKQAMEIAKGNQLALRLKDRIAMPFDSTDVGLANLYELWDWQERQAKYIVNSVRVYDQFKLDWWLPQWDWEFVRFWEGVPLILRRERIWFKDWIIEQYANQTLNQADAKSLKNAGDSLKFIKILSIVAKKLPTPAFKALKFLWKKKPKANHFLAFEGLIHEQELKNYSSSDFNIIGIYSDLYISDKW